MQSPRIPANSSISQAAWILSVLLLCQSPAFANCADDWFAVDEVRLGDQLELRAANRQAYPITYSIRVRAPLADEKRSRAFSGTLLGGESASLITLPDRGEKDAVRLSCNWTIGSRNAVHNDDHLYLLPYADGTSYRVLQGFGSKFSHRGTEQYAVDFKMKEGTAVHAARGGVVVRVEESNSKGCWEDGCGAYANFIVVLHDDGTTGEYYHLQQNGALVEAGERVTAGQKIGLSGNTGHTALPHLHFAVYRATNNARSQSLPISFLSSDGVVYQPRRGHHYLAVMSQRAGD